MINVSKIYCGFLPIWSVDMNREDFSTKCLNWWQHLFEKKYHKVNKFKSPYWCWKKMRGGGGWLESKYIFSIQGFCRLGLSNPNKAHT